MAKEPVGPSGSGADLANALSKLEAAPASTLTVEGSSTGDKPPAVGRKEWYLRDHPAIGAFLLEQAEYLPGAVIDRLTLVFDGFLRQNCPPELDLKVAARIRELLTLPDEERSRRVVEVMLEKTSSKLHGDLRELKAEISRKTAIFRTMRGLITFLGAALVEVGNEETKLSLTA